jgi:hypothetical protein
MYVQLFLFTLITGQLRFNSQPLDQQSGIYFENQGPLKIITSKWDLTSYLDLTFYNNNTQATLSVINTMDSYCDNLISYNQSAEIFKCLTFLRQAKILGREIESKRDAIFNTISYKHKEKRGISFKSMSKVAQLIFGTCDFNCIANAEKYIKDMVMLGVNEIKIPEKQTKIIKITQDKESSVIKRPLGSTDESRTVGTALEMRNTVILAYSQANLLLTQFAYETNTIFQIVQAAKIGQIHPTLLNQDQLLSQFKDVKLNLPSGTDLPLELDIANANDILKLSEIAIYHAGNNLVFKIGIPLIYQHILTLYHLLPKPVCKINNCVYIKPSFNYVAISKSKDLYTTYDHFDRLQCNYIQNCLLCPEIHPLHPRSTRPNCEISLFQDPKEVPDTCEIMHVQIATSLFHKLKNKNAWLYTTMGETIFVTCENDQQSTSLPLERVGILTLNDTCKAYATRDILIPGEVKDDTEYPDFIPSSKIQRLEELISEISSNNVVNTKHIKNNQMNELNDIAKTQGQVEDYKIILGIQTNQNNRYHQDYILYVTSAIVTLTLILFMISILNKLITKKITARRQLQPPTIETPTLNDESEPHHTDQNIPIPLENYPLMYPKLRTEF